MTYAAASNGQPNTRYLSWIADHYPHLRHRPCGPDVGDMLLHLISPAVNLWSSLTLFALASISVVAAYKHLRLLCPTAPPKYLTQRSGQPSSRPPSASCACSTASTRAGA